MQTDLLVSLVLFLNIIDEQIHTFEANQMSKHKKVFYNTKKDLWRDVTKIITIIIDDGRNIACIYRQRQSLLCQLC